MLPNVRERSPVRTLRTNSIAPQTLPFFGLKWLSRIHVLCPFIAVRPFSEHACRFELAKGEKFTIDKSVYYDRKTLRPVKAT